MRKILYLSRRDVEYTNITMREVINTVEAMFIEKGKGNVEMPPKPGIHTKPDAFMHAMPAYIPALKAAGLKWVTGFPENYKKHLPLTNGIMVLNDIETGLALSVMDCTWVTAMRTGAATAISAKYLAKKDSSNVGIIACGVQGRSNLEALSCIFNIKKVKAYDIKSEVAKKFAKEMQLKLSLNIELVSTPKEAVVGMDIIVTSGPIRKNPEPVIEDKWFSPGSFASLVDFTSYWKTEVLQKVDKISTDDIEQMNVFRKIGYFKDTPEPYADLGDIVIGKKPGREDDKERILSINLGLALEDIAVAPLIYKRAIDLDIGVNLPL